MFIALAQMARYGNQSAGQGIGTPVRGSMMGGWNSSTVWSNSALGIVTWIAVIAVLIALFRLLWKKGDKLK